MKSHLMAVLAASLSALAIQPAVGSTPQAASTSANEIRSRATPILVEELISLENPWGMEVLPDGAVLITEKPGRLRLFSKGTLSAPLAGVPTVVFRDQGGLLDVILDPNFASNRMVYLSFSEAAEAQPGGNDVADTRLGVFQDLSDGTLKGLAVAKARLGTERLEDVRVIWRAEKTVGRNHFAGRMAFLPDGSLLITSGDRQRFEPSQDRASDIGKVIRIRPADGSSLPDNPFAAGPGSHRDVYTLGHRNPLGIAVRPGTAEVWVAEMGPQNGDELNLLLPGRNYGWPLVSPGDNYDGTPLNRPSTRPDFEPARESFPLAISPASLTFYNGTRFGPWNGHVLVGALNRPGIVRGVPGPDGVHDLEHIETGFRVRDIAVAPDGTLFVLRDGPKGALIRLSPKPN